MIIKEVLDIYKEQKRIENEKKKLLTSMWDVQAFQDLIKKVNKNPGLKVKLGYPDGRFIELSTYDEPTKRTNPYEEFNEYEV